MQLALRFAHPGRGEGLRSQSPYGAQSLATFKTSPWLTTGYLSRNPLTGLNPLQPEDLVECQFCGVLMSQSPYGAQSLATRWQSGCGQHLRKRCRNPLTGLNPLQPELTHDDIQRDAMVAIPLRGSIPCNLRVVLPGEVPTVFPSRNPLTGLNPLQQSLGSRSSTQARQVAIPLRGSIPCNTRRPSGRSPPGTAGRNPLTGLNPLQPLRRGPRW